MSAPESSRPASAHRSVQQPGRAATVTDGMPADPTSGPEATALQGDYDGAPWCQYCGAKRERDCDCGPIARNH